MWSGHAGMLLSRIAKSAQGTTVAAVEGLGLFCAALWAGVEMIPRRFGLLPRGNREPGSRL